LPFISSRFFYRGFPEEIPNLGVFPTVPVIDRRCPPAFYVFFPPLGFEQLQLLLGLSCHFPKVTILCPCIFGLLTAPPFFAWALKGTAGPPSQPPQRKPSSSSNATVTPLWLCIIPSGVQYLPLFQYPPILSTHLLSHQFFGKCFGFLFSMPLHVDRQSFTPQSFIVPPHIFTTTFDRTFAILLIFLNLRSLHGIVPLIPSSYFTFLSVQFLFFHLAPVSVPPKSGSSAFD